VSSTSNVSASICGTALPAISNWMK